MSITTDYTAAQVCCPKCPQPLRVDFDWGRKLRVTRNVMTCCNSALTIGETNVLLSKIRAAREGAKG